MVPLTIHIGEEIGMRGKRNKYYRTILAMYLIIVAVYTFVLVGVFTHYSYVEFSTINEKDKQVMLGQIKESIDTMLQTSEATQNQLVSSSSFSDVIMRDGYLEKIIFQRDLSRISGNILNRGCSITVIYGTGSSNAISTTGFIGSKSDFYTAQQFDEEDVAAIDEYILNGTASDIFTVASTFENERMLTVLRKPRLYRSYNVVFCYNYSFDYILGSIYAGDNEVAIYRDGDILISNNMSDDYNPELLAEAAGGLFGKAGETGTDTYKDGKEKFRLYTIGSDVGDWGYIMAVSEKERSDVIKKIVLMAVIIFLFLICVGVFVIKRLTEIVYNPVRKLIDTAELDEEGLDDEFAALKSVMDRGKSRYDELQKYIMDNKSGKEYFLKDLLNSNCSSEELDGNKRKYMLEWLDGRGYIIVFGIMNAEKLRKELGDINFYGVRDEIAEFLGEKIRERAECEIVCMSAERIAAVIRGEKSEALETYLVEQVSRIEYSTSVEIKIFVSDMADGAGSYGNEYSKISESVSNRLMFSRVIIDYGDSVHNRKMWYYPIELEKNLIENTLSGARESVKLIIDRIYEENFKNDCLDERDYTQMIFAVTETVNRILQALDTEPEQVFGEDNKLYNRLALCRDNDEIRDIMYEIFSTLCEFVEQQRAEMSHSLANEMLRYINENYQQGISLYDVAEHFNYSVNYISHVFSRETGKNFKEYLSLVRVARAKDMLRAGGCTISQVATAVGCANSNSFIRLFKRYEGITPGQYIDSIGKNN